MATSLGVNNCEKPCIKRRVLIIEDNRDAREMFRMMLELAGHEVLEAEEGHAGLSLLKTAHPDIAVVDVGLPGLTGYEIARRFHDEAPAAAAHVMLVALTGYGTPEARERSRQAGFDYHLIKPVNAEALDEIMRVGLDGHDPHPVPPPARHSPAATSANSPVAAHTAS